MQTTQIARMNQTIIEGEVVSVTLELISGDARVHLVDGDSFYTLTMNIDPWEVQ